MYLAGKIFREIRISKNYTLENIADGIMSISQLSKFERDEHDISFLKFIEILNRVNVSLSEFEFIANNFELNYIDTLIKKMRQFYTENNIIAMENLYVSETKKAEYSELQFHTLNSIMIQVLLNDLNGTPLLVPKQSDVLVNYLFGVENWTYYEIVLFANSISGIKKDVIIILGKELIRKSNYYISLNQNRKYVIHTILNICISMLLRNEQKDFHYFIKSASALINNEELLFEKCLLLFVSGLYDLSNKNQHIGENKVENALNVLEILDSYNLYMNYYEFYDKFKKEIK